MFSPRTAFHYDRKLFWRPGHQYKALKALERGIGNIDLVVQVRDARVPFSSASPSIQTALGRRDSLVVFNKSDLANANMQKVSPSGPLVSLTPLARLGRVSGVWPSGHVLQRQERRFS